jgi:SAM-dependent methyltransferase
MALARRRARVVPYGDLAEAYDILHARKPYGREALQIRTLARQAARRPCRTLLDVACGSGRHLEQLARWYACTGVDPSPQMLLRARRRVRGAELVRGTMESFALDREFDIVTCLFSSIGYVRTVAELRRAVRNLARHTAPGGVLVIEPWLTPAAFRSGLVHHLVARSGPTTVVRMNGSSRRGGRSIFDFHYLVGRRGHVEHAVERHELGLFSRRTMESALRAAGCTVRYFDRGLASRRGLYVAVRPGGLPTAPSSRPTAVRSRPSAGR